MTVSRDDPVLRILEEEFAKLGIEPGPARGPRKEKEAMLPTEKTPPRMNLSDLTVLVHGPAKIGKSTLCSQAPDALFLATEAGLNALEVYQIAIKDWSEFLAACREVKDGKHEFMTIVVDTLDNLYRMCSEHVCTKHKIQHESDLGYGKGFALVNNEFYRALNKLSLLPYGLFLISHSQEKEIETRTGKHTRIVPSLPDKARRMVLGMVDVILYCDVETVVDTDGKATTERRVMRTKPTETYEAGDRTGRLPDVIDLDYAKFVEAFERAKPDAKAPAPSPAPEPEEKQYATDAQVKEFDELVEALGVPPKALARRLAQFEAADAFGVARDDMEKILVRLRASWNEKKAATERAAAPGEDKAAPGEPKE